MATRATRASHKGRWRVGVAATALLAALSGAVGSAGATPKPVSLTVWGWPGSSNAFAKSIPAFTKKYPWIHLTLDYMAYGTVVDKLAAAIAAGSAAPGLSWVSVQEMQRFISTGGILNVTKYVTPYEKDYPKYKIAAEEANGQVYAFPGDLGPVVLWYDEALFSKYGITSPPVTWDQYIADGKVLKKHGIDMAFLPNPILTTPVQPITTWFEFMLQEAGGALYSTTGRATVDSPQGMEALKTFVKVYKSGIGANINLWTPAEWDALRAQKVATNLDGGWWMNVLPDYVKSPAQGSGSWGVAPMPVFKAGQKTGADDGGSYLVVPSQIKGEMRTAAIDFAVFETSNVAAQTGWAEYGLVPGYEPALESPQLANFTRSTFGDQKLFPVIEQAAKVIPTSYNMPAAYPQASDYIDSTITDVVDGKISPAAYLKKLTTVLNGFEEQYVAPS